MSMSSVTTRGFGNGAFVGSINLVVSLGYGIGAAAVEYPEDGWTASKINRVAVAHTHGRSVVSPKQNRVVWARNQGR